MEEKIIKMPKIELHLHLDGSVSQDLLEKFSKLSHDDVIKKAISNNDRNLGEYLDHFKFINEYLQTQENLELASFTLGKSLEKENVIYAEVRFAPFNHTKKGLTPDEVIEAVLNGFNKCNLKVNLILCMLRGMDLEYNKKVIELANKYLNKGVVAVDLAGDEEKYPFKDYKYLFEILKHANIPSTIHAGETNKRDIIDVLTYTKRIGHGIKIYDDINLINLVKKNNTLLEVCPNSNIDTINVIDYQSHPIKALYQNGVKVCINTDNRTVSDISLTEEYLNLIRYLGFTYDDLLTMNINALEYAFITEKEKQYLRNILTKKGF